MRIEPTWWISVVEAPVVAALFWMIHGLRRDLQDRIDRSDQRESEAVGRTRQDLADFKLEVVGRAASARPASRAAGLSALEDEA